MQRSGRHLQFCLLGLLAVYFAWRHGAALYRLCSNQEMLQSSLQLLGIWAPLGFVLLTAAQVIIAPIPAVALSLAGGYVFGLLPGFALSVAGLLVGSMLAFVLARRFGQPLVLRLIGVDTYRRLEPMLQGRGLWIVALVFLLPLMPDDALCFLAALTPMRARVFAILVLTCRSPGVLAAALTGSGAISLPWYLWAGIALLSLLLLYVGWRHAATLENWASRLARRLDRQTQPEH